MDCSFMSKPFSLEIFSGSGRLAAAVRSDGTTVIEIDINEQGGRRNLLSTKTFEEIRRLISHPQCVGVWFGFPCGTFSSARRYGGGPPPLRGTNSKDIWGLPHLQGVEEERVRSANKLLLRMHALMKLCEQHAVPFYLENPMRSKLWLHPLTKQWLSHPCTTAVGFDYCQFDTPCTTSTTTHGLQQSTFSSRIVAEHARGLDSLTANGLHARAPARITKLSADS